MKGELNLLKCLLFTGNSPSVSSILNIGYDAFEEKQSSQPLMYPAEGKLLLFNTMESFRDCDKQQLADQEGALVRMILSY